MTSRFAKQLEDLLLRIILRRTSEPSVDSNASVLEEAGPQIREFFIANGQDLASMDETLRKLPKDIARWICT
jgi:hypothetical protein